MLGLGEHLRGAQLRKFGFRFFFSEGRRDLHRVTELGASRPLPVPSYQIDRGIFENFLGEECQRRGIRFVDNALIRKVTLTEDGTPHQLQLAASRRAAAAHQRALGHRRLRPRRADQEAARSGAGQRARGARRVVPHQRPHRTSTTGWTTARTRSLARDAASRPRAGCRPTTWSARATGCG